MSKPILDFRHILGLTIRIEGDPVQMWPAHLQWCEYYAKQAVNLRNEQWVTAFKAYQQALSEPYFDQDDESRQTNRAEVERCFDRLKQLAEEV